jgi:hypothetical protein
MNPCNQFSRAVSASGRRRSMLLLTGSIVVALALTAVMAAPNAQAWPSINQQAKKACKKKKKSKAKKTCIRKKKKQLNRTKGDVSVMTRNLYLGADLGPAIRSAGLSEFFDANGQILRDVDANDFPTRARGLAAEIRGKSPDVVGLQEVSLWRTGDPAPPKVKPATPPGDFTTKTVKYDFLNLLMRELNKGKRRYQVVKVTTEFDFEGPANYDTSIPYPEINGRLTMRDVIIAKVGAGVTWTNARGGNFSTIYEPVVSGLDVTVDRGWNSADFKVRNAPRFRFVNVHLEAFGDDKNLVRDCMTEPAEEFASNPVSIRCSQAKELHETIIEPSKLPVIALGDFNSNDQSDWDPNCPSEANVGGTLPGNNGGVCGDEFAYRALTTLGMRNIGTSNPLSCCLKAELMEIGGGGARSDFDHQVDHILTRNSDKVTRLSSSVTGLRPVNGFWNSDHAGLFSKLRIRP